MLVSVGLLMLLSSIAVMYMVQTRETVRKVTSSSLKNRARFLASSGLENVLSKDLTQLATGTSTLYRGEDWNGDYESSSLPVNQRSEDWNGNQNERLDREGLPVQYALSPSFPVDREPDNNKPDLIEIRQFSGAEQTKQRGFSGQLPSTFNGGSDTYSLKVRDNSTRLNVNSQNDNMKKVINRLYRHKQSLLGDAPPLKDPETPPGDAIWNFKNEQGGSLSNLHQLQEVLSADIYQFLAPHLVLDEHTWVDHSVIKPDPRQNKPPTSNDMNFEIQPRAPININRAPEFVLSALIQGIQAKPMEVRLTGEDPPHPNYRIASLGPITKTEALEIASAIVKYRKEENEPFETWNDFEQFIETKLVQNGIISKGKGYLMKAHFNPNTRLAKQNANRAGQWSWTVGTGGGPPGKILQKLDKSDFTYHTTEFSLYSTGFFEVRSLGRVTGENKVVRASTTLKARIRPYRIARHTSQYQFQKFQSGNNTTTAEYLTYPKFLNSNRASAQNRKRGVMWAGSLSLAPNHYSGSTPGSFAIHFNDRSSLSKMDRKLQTNPARAVDDLTPDGMLLSSDRERFFRIRPSEQSRSALSTRGWWLNDGAAVSLWWKPRINFPENGEITAELFHGWFLAERFSIELPFWMDTMMTGDNQLMAGNTSRGVHTEFRRKAIGKNGFFNTEIPGVHLGQAAGYRIRMYYKHEVAPPVNRPNGFYLDVSFEIFPDPPGGSHIWTGTHPEELQAPENLIAGRVLTILPESVLSQNNALNAGSWNHVVFNWKPETFPDLRYPNDRDGNSSNGIDTTQIQPPKRKLLAGNIFVNGNTSNNPIRKIWANQATEDTIDNPDQLFDKLRPYNMMLTAHLFRDRDNPSQLLHNTSYDPGKVRVIQRHAIENFSNHIWLGGTRMLTRPERNEKSVFAEGTIDAVQIHTNHSAAPPNPEDGFGNQDGRYPSSSDVTSPIYEGIFPRSDPDASVSEKQTTLVTGYQNTIDILLLAHTQYSPPEDQDKQFAFTFSTGSKSRSPNNTWNGGAESPEQLFGTNGDNNDQCMPEQLEICSGNNLSYQIRPKNMFAHERPHNNTPFFEDITIFYRIKDKSPILNVQYVSQQ